MSHESTFQSSDFKPKQFITRYKGQKHAMGNMKKNYQPDIGTKNIKGMFGCLQVFQNFANNREMIFECKSFIGFWDEIILNKNIF